MKTRNILLIAAFTAFMANAQAFAQQTSSATRQNRADVNELLEKRSERMKSLLKLDDATAAKFSPLYKEYLTELKACHPSRTNKKEQKLCCDADKKQQMERELECREKMIKTQKKYYKEFEKFLNAEQLETLFKHRHHAGKRNDRAYRHNRHCNQQHPNRHESCEQQNCRTHGHRR